MAEIIFTKKKSRTISYTVRIDPEILAELERMKQELGFSSVAGIMAFGFRKLINEYKKNQCLIVGVGRGFEE